MFDIKTVEIELGGKTLKLETGRVARQADGAVLATLGETVVLCAVTAAKSVKPGQDFFPLTVHYQEKFSAAGRIPGGFFKRERGATEKETLTSRLIDRPIRPLFPEGFYNEVLVIAQVLSYDGENEPDIVAMIAASAALTISGVPFMGPIGAARVGFVDGEYILNPQPGADQGRQPRPRRRRHAQRRDDGRIRSQGAVGRRRCSAPSCSPTRPRSRSARRSSASPKRPPRTRGSSPPATTRPRPRPSSRPSSARTSRPPTRLTDKSAAPRARSTPPATRPRKRSPRPTRRSRWSPSKAVKSLEADIVRTAILKEGRRIDGRDTKTVRPIEAMVGFLPRTHGSALFTRGETQAIVTTTLGTKESEQMIDGLEGLSYSRFMLHYNFPPYSVGEVGRFGAPSRRETGHGKLAWRALHPMLPSVEEFPYTIRVLSRHHRDQRLLVDGHRLRRLAGDDGRRRAAEAPGRRHRHGPDPRRQGLRGDQRHPRRRGSSRRHGLQGRRHVRRHHRAADGHQGRRHHRGDHEGRPRPGQGGPRPHPRRNGQGARPHPRGASRPRAAHRDHVRSPRTRSAKSSAPAARSSARSSPPPAPRSTSTTRA